MFQKAKRAVVSLGSNIEPRKEYLEKAIEALSRLPSTRLIAKSDIIETEGVDVPEEFASMNFLNMAAIFETSLDAFAFSRQMHAIEDALGRRRTIRNGPRTIDIDLIDFDGERIDTPELILPHPRWQTRDFVKIPLAQLNCNPSAPMP